MRTNAVCNGTNTSIQPNTNNVYLRLSLPPSTKFSTSPYPPFNPLLTPAVYQARRVEYTKSTSPPFSLAHHLHQIMSSDVVGQFELHKAQVRRSCFACPLQHQRLPQVIGSLSTLANNLRECASYADQFAQVIHALPWGGQPGAFPIPNGQYPISMMPPMPMVHDDHGKKRKSRDEDGRRKQKKPRDPNAPKRPPSSYLLFQNDVRAELKAKHPEMRNNELLGAIAKLWGSMPQEQKDVRCVSPVPSLPSNACPDSAPFLQVYEARNKVAKDEWMAQKKVYEAGKPGAPGEPVVRLHLLHYVGRRLTAARLL